jgi:Lipocalin-like domain
LGNAGADDMMASRRGLGSGGAEVTITAAAEVRAALLGAWRLLSLRNVQPDGTVSYPLGPGAVGQLVYSENGRMSAQLMRPGTPGFQAENAQQATDAEKLAAYGNYTGYYGSFRIDADAGAVIHEVEGSTFPNMIGTDQVRYYHIEGDRLDLEADSPPGRSYVAWQKF